MRVPFSALCTVALTVFATASLAQAADAVKYPAVLAGHAILPADAKVMPPADAPADLKNPGKFTGPGNKRLDAIGRDAGRAPRPRAGTRISRASPAIPCRSRASRCRGISGIKKPRPTATFLGDHRQRLRQQGELARRHASDLNHWLKIDWASGKAERTRHDLPERPRQKAAVPHHANEAHRQERYLTGSDFDTESLSRRSAIKIWIGDEFGPYLDPRPTWTGKVEAVFETMAWTASRCARPTTICRHERRRRPTGRSSRSTTSAAPRASRAWRQSPDGKFLYPLLEGADVGRRQVRTSRRLDGHARPICASLEFDASPSPEVDRPARGNTFSNRTATMRSATST